MSLQSCPSLNAKLWEAREVVESTLHPTSGELLFFLSKESIATNMMMDFVVLGDVLPWPFRVSAIAPVNIPLVWGMLVR